jgi:uncharacterized protein YndB with AHSA1/START domain
LAEYRFLTTWCLEAPIDPVWEAIHDSERWPGWWRGVEKVVELEPGDENGMGHVGEYTWKSKLPYELVFQMRTTQQWMNLLAPVARPIFAWNHDWVMGNGATGLARLLGVRLLSASGGLSNRSQRGLP